MTAPLAPASVSLRLYPHQGLDPEQTVRELLDQGRLAAEAGFHGVMTSEHHGGFAGYLPNPLQVAGWLLDVMPRGWAAACPLLLPLRPPALVVEEVAWLAARFPGRVGVGVASGALAQDFEIAGLDMERLTERFAEGLAFVCQALAGDAYGPLAADTAVARCASAPVPVVSAAASSTAARRAAAHGAGIILDSLSPPERCRRLADAYRAAGGTGAVILVRRAWIGHPPGEAMRRQENVYRSYSGSAARQWGRDEVVSEGNATALAATLLDLSTRAGADALNLRVHVPGVAPADARAQIEALARVVEEVSAGFAELRRSSS